MIPHPITRHAAHETWTLRKPAVQSRHGIAATHHYAASRVAAQVLADGGNAVDAAVAASFAIGTVEPWMSGLGGGGYMLVHLAAERQTWCVDFGVIASRNLDPGAYALVEGSDADLFGWPAVVDDRNVSGPLSVAVPGQVAGMDLALRRFGSRSLAESLQPAIAMAAAGMHVDWYATLKIAADARDLARFPESARIYLPDGFPPAAAWGGPLPLIRLGNLERTLRRLAEAGADDFYRGELARELLADAAECGIPFDATDLAGYTARVRPAAAASYRDMRVHTAPGLTAGPTLHRALALAAEHWTPGAAPDAAAYLAYACSLQRAYTERLASMGEGEPSSASSSTTHLSVCDAQGNLVALTQTLLSVFGSRLVLPRTGMLMNNGVMWFDPRPGGPNSLAPGRRPLTNMCPAVLELGDGRRVALGASGGRRIMPAVYQLASFLGDFHMSLDQAFHTPRIDWSGAPAMHVDAALPAAVAETLAQHFAVEVAHHTVYAAMYACPNAVVFDRNDGSQSGSAFVTSPWGEACAAAVPDAR